MSWFINFKLDNIQEPGKDTLRGFYMDREQNIHDLSTKEGRQAYRRIVNRPFIEWIKLYNPYNQWYLPTYNKYCP